MSSAHDAAPEAQQDTAAPDAALLAHYKERVEAFEEERKELLDNIDLIKVQHEEVHRMRWECRAREEEVSETTKRRAVVERASAAKAAASRTWGP